MYFFNLDKDRNLIPIPLDCLEFGKIEEQANNKIREDILIDKNKKITFIISTVFLGVATTYDSLGLPEVFETSERIY